MEDAGELQPQELSGQDALKLIRAWIKADSRCVKFRPHSKLRGKQRGITLRQMLTCLERGIVTEPPHINAQGNWQFDISRAAAGEEITCGVAIGWQSKQVFVLTAFPRRG